MRPLTVNDRVAVLTIGKHLEAAEKAMVKLTWWHGKQCACPLCMASENLWATIGHVDVQLNRLSKQKV